MQVGTLEPSAWKQPSAQMDARGMPNASHTFLAANQTLPIAGKRGWRTDRRRSALSRRDTRMCISSRFALLFTVAHALFCFAGSSRVHSFSARHRPFGTGKCNLWRTDHPPHFAPGQRALLTPVLFAQISKCAESLDARRTACQVSPVMDTGGNVPLVFWVWTRVRKFCGIDAWGCHGGIALRFWHPHSLLPSLVRGDWFESPGGGSGLGLLRDLPVRREHAQCERGPGGGLRLGRDRFGRCLGLVRAHRCDDPGGGLRLDHFFGEQCQLWVLMHADHGDSLGGGKRLDSHCDRVCSVLVDAWHDTHPGGGKRLGFVLAGYCQTAASAPCGHHRCPGGGIRLRHAGDRHDLFLPHDQCGSTVGIRSNHFPHTAHSCGRHTFCCAIPLEQRCVLVRHISWAQRPSTPVPNIHRMSSISTTAESFRSRLGTEGIIDTAGHYRDSAVSFDTHPMSDPGPKARGASRHSKGKGTPSFRLSRSPLLRPKPEGRRRTGRSEDELTRERTPRTSRRGPEQTRVRPRKGEIELFMSVLGSPVSQALDAHGTMEASVLRFFRDVCAPKPSTGGSTANPSDGKPADPARHPSARTRPTHGGGERDWRSWGA